MYEVRIHSRGGQGGVTAAKLLALAAFRDGKHATACPFYGAERRGAPVDLFDRGILEPKMAEADLPRLRSLLRNRERVWLIYSHDWYTDPQQLIPATLDDALTIADSQQLRGLQVRLYTVPTPDP